MAFAEEVACPSRCRPIAVDLGSGRVGAGRTEGEGVATRRWRRGKCPFRPKWRPVAIPPNTRRCSTTPTPTAACYSMSAIREPKYVARTR